jgi:soluble lytic murein transglycosylase-like protein
MRTEFALSCLLATWLLFGSAVPASIASSRVDDTRISQPTALAIDNAMDLPEIDALKGPIDDEEPAPDEPKDTPLTSLERARVALAETNAPVLSNREICTTLVKVAQANALPVGFFTNLIWRESNFDHFAVSRVGAMGIAQFMPDVADRMGLDDAFDARDALPASGKLLRTLRTRFGNLGLVAAAYNAGPKRVADWLEQRSELPKETRDYVSIITGRPAEQWRGKARANVFNVPRHVPCHRSEEFSSVERTERLVQERQVAEEKRLEEQAREAARRQKEAQRRNKKRKPARPIVASSGRSG